MRDGVRLYADLYQPRSTGAVPVLVAIAPYARQAQYLGLPAGMVEAGQTDFWVPRGYAHLIRSYAGAGPWRRRRSQPCLTLIDRFTPHCDETETHASLFVIGMRHCCAIVRST